jgi:hypothetical protein
MQVGQIYSCKFRHRYERHHIDKLQGWDMLLFLRTETIDRSDGVIITNYRFYDILSGETRLLDEGLIKYCKEVVLEEI